MNAKFPSHPEHQFMPPFHFELGDTSALTAFLGRIARYAVDLLGLEECAVALADAQSSSLLLLATSQEGVPVGQGTLPLHTDLVAAVAEKKKLRVLANAHFDACM